MTLTQPFQKDSIDTELTQLTESTESNLNWLNQFWDERSYWSFRPLGTLFSISPIYMRHLSVELLSMTVYPGGEDE